QPPLLYVNRGDDRFAVASAGDLDTPLVARGAAYADLDGDGDLDVIVVENGGPARIFINRLDRPQQSLRLRLIGSGKSNRDAVGARVKATILNQLVNCQVSGGSSYLSSPEKTLTFGLGVASQIDTLEIVWPDGAKQTLRDLPGGQSLTVEENHVPTATPLRRPAR